MASSLVFPDGVRLATLDELPGPSDRRDADWARISAANIAPGFVLKAVHGQSFRYYAEANVDAHDIWAVFCDLTCALMDRRGSLLLGFKDDAPAHVAEGSIEAILDALRPEQDQLTHDGYLQFGIVCEGGSGLSEVFVAPSKHFKVWFSDERAFAKQMVAHGLVRAERLEFIDEYPRTTTRLVEGRARSVEELKALMIGRLADTGARAPGDQG